MGQYFCLVNETKKEFAHSPDFVKLWEWAVNFGSRLFLAHLLNGSWNGDRIALIGDYNEQRVTYDDLEKFTEVFPLPSWEDYEDTDAYWRICKERNKEVLSLIKDEKVAPVYYCIDRNEYIAVSEIDGDETNILGALLYLIAFSYEKGEKVPDWEKVDDVLPSRWAFCEIEARNDVPRGARSVTREAMKILKKEGAFRNEAQRKKWKEYLEKKLLVG